MSSLSQHHAELAASVPITKSRTYESETSVFCDWRHVTHFQVCPSALS